MLGHLLLFIYYSEHFFYFMCLHAFLACMHLPHGCPVPELEEGIGSHEAGVTDGGPGTQTQIIWKSCQNS